jgi:hypothetical protein
MRWQVLVGKLRSRAEAADAGTGAKLQGWKLGSRSMHVRCIDRVGICGVHTRG